MTLHQLRDRYPFVCTHNCHPNYKVHPELLALLNQYAEIASPELQVVLIGRRWDEDYLLVRCSISNFVHNWTLDVSYCEPRYSGGDNFTRVKSLSNASVLNFPTRGWYRNPIIWLNYPQSTLAEFAPALQPDGWQHTIKVINPRLTGTLYSCCPVGVSATDSLTQQQILVQQALPKLHMLSMPHMLAKIQFVDGFGKTCTESVYVPPHVDTNKLKKSIQNNPRARLIQLDPSS